METRTLFRRLPQQFTVLHAAASQDLTLRLSPGGRLPELPQLSQVADLWGGTPRQWEDFLLHYGLLEFEASWVVPSTAHEELLRIPVRGLQRTALRAIVLLAAEAIALRRSQTLQQLDARLREALRAQLRDEADLTAEQRKRISEMLRSQGTTPEQLFVALAEIIDGHVALPASAEAVAEQPVQALGTNELEVRTRHIIARELERVLMQAEAKVDPIERGIPGTWAFFVKGSWPLIVLFRFVHREERYFDIFPRGTCQAEGCSNRLPKGRRKYCSTRCYEREKKRCHRKSKHDMQANRKGESHLELENPPAERSLRTFRRPAAC